MTVSRPGAPPGATATLMIRVCVGDGEPRVRAASSTSADRPVTAQTVTGPAPICAAVARWPAK
jgi:hypothetical protein